jgi:uncharacterized membrane protein (DUF4010 family)
MDLTHIAGRLGLALCLGLLVGLQRERVRHPLGGVRTFALITVFGSLCALLAGPFGAWTVAAGLLGAAAALVVGAIRAGDVAGPGPHLTTIFAGLLMFGVGAWLVAGDPAVAVVVAGGLTVLLHLKDRLHQLIESLGKADVTAVMQFVLITLVILPILPDRAFGPYQVVNPREVWLLVVLIVTIALGGYVAHKLLGARAGTLLGAILGGLISSTATTVSFARRTAAGESHRLAAMAVMLASGISTLRVVGIVAVVAPAGIMTIAPPLIALAGTMLALAAVLWFTSKREASAVTEYRNPAQLVPAMVFAGLYALILLAVAWAREHVGDQAIYAVAAVSGATDMDAITLTAGRMFDKGTLDAGTVWRAILVATLANAVFKAGCAATLGSRRLAWLVGLLFAGVIAAGVAILLLWPAG